MNNLSQIKTDEVYKQMMVASFNGIIYDNADHFQGNHLLQLWKGMTPSEQESAGGIVKGAMVFLNEQKEVN